MPNTYKVIRTLISALAAASVVCLSLIAPQVATAAPNVRNVNEKVTICHRTHATTNPYRQITVSMAAVVGNGASGNGHGDPDATGANKHNPYNVDAGKVFNPAFSYPSNAKQWQDIIPPFNYKPANGNPGNYPGLNWDAVGKAIYYGYTYGGVNYAGLCSKMSAKEFADREFSAGQSKNDALKDAKDQGAEEDGNLEGNKLNTKNFDNLPNPPQRPKGPEVPTQVKDLQAQLDQENLNKDPAVDAIKQAIAGVVWEDSNRNGLHDNGEQLFNAVGIQLVDPTTGQPVSFRSNNQPAATLSAGVSVQTVGTVITVYTDPDGYFHIDNVPEGDWTVKVITPTGYSYTYDSNGTGDGAMPGTYVPSGGLGFAWAGLVQGPQQADPLASGGTNGGSGSSLANTGSTVPYGTLVFGVLLTLAGGYVVSRNRK